MATLATTHPTLLDLAKRQDPDGKIAKIVEILNQTNDILDHMVWIEGNLPTGHRTTIRTGLPAPTWRKLYGGVQPTKSRTAQITATTGMLEAFAEVDVAMADLNGNTAEFRLSEDIPHIEGMSQEMAATLIYGNEATEPEAFTGLAPQFNDLSAENADNIIVGGGSQTDNGSIWLLGWGPQAVHGIIPKGSKAGLQHEDMGRVVIENADGAGGRMVAYRSHYRWDAGLVVKDWRNVVRIPNIDKSSLSSTYTSGAFSSGAHLPNLMFDAIRRLPNLGGVRPQFYMSRDMLTMLCKQVSAAVQGSTLTTEEVGGKMITSFMGIPIGRVDAMAADEALVS